MGPYFRDWNKGMIQCSAEGKWDLVGLGIEEGRQLGLMYV